MVQQQSADDQFRMSAATADRVIGQTPTYAPSAETRYVAPAARADYRTDVDTRRDNVRWGPVLAGAASAFGVTVILSVLGLAIGSSAFKPGTDVTDWTSSAGIWGIITVVVAFFVAGFVAGRTAALWSAMQAGINGFVAGAAYLTALVIFGAATGANFLGFLGSNVNSIANVGSGATTTLNNNYNTVKDAAWGTFLVLAVGMVLATVAGVIGHGTAEAMDDASA
jgi:hypothetical protein